jgi:hypothetical protein
MALAEGGHPEYMSESIHELNSQFLIFNSQFSIINAAGIARTSSVVSPSRKSKDAF